MEVVDDTHITLRTPFTGSSASGKTYSIDRNYQSMQLADLAADVASVMHKYDTHIDAQTHIVTGMSAYEIVMICIASVSLLLKMIKIITDRDQKP